MSKRRKGKKRPQGTQLIERVRRELAKGNAKTALKDAEQCFRSDPSPVHRLLLEEAYAGRVEQLQRMKLPAEARAVLARLMELKPTSPDVLAKIPRLQVIIGDPSADAESLFAQDPGLLEQQVDQAVLDRRLEAPDVNTIRAQVEHVREAFAAVERGEDEQAGERLKEIPRTSPLVDWKLFLRGLIAFYASERERTLENWRRLAPARPARRIACTLLTAAGEECPGEPPANLPLRRLQMSIQDDQAGAMVKECARHCREGDWDGFIEVYRRLRQRYGTSHAETLQRIVDVVWKRAVREQDDWLLDRIIQIGPAPPLDPHWNRARALQAERSEDKYVDPVELYWRQYAEDVAELPILNEEERRIASGLVYLHLARAFVYFAEGCEQASLLRGVEDEESDLLRRDAIGYFEQSIRRCPRLFDAYRELARLHEKQEEPEVAAGVMRRLLEQRPDEFEAHLWLANHHLGNDDAEGSAPHVEAAARLKPRDAHCLQLAWHQRLTAVRMLTKKRQFDEARLAWEALADVQRDREPYTLDVIRAGIELKAKNLELGREYVEAALQKAGEAAPVWLEMSCTAARYGLPREMKKEFDENFKKTIKRKPDGQTAGRLARFLLGLEEHQVNYTGRATQKKLVLKYLRRAKRVVWQERDLESVCMVVVHERREHKMRHRLVKLGLEQFPENAYFHLAAGGLAMEAGPIWCDRDYAVDHMQQAAELGRRSSDPTRRTIVEQAEHALALLGPADDDPLSYDDEFDDDDEDAGDDEFDDEYEFFAAPDDEGDAADPRGGSGRGAPPDLSPEEMLALMRQVVPPQKMKQFERDAAKHGVTLLDVIKDLSVLSNRGSA